MERLGSQLNRLVQAASSIWKGLVRAGRIVVGERVMRTNDDSDRRRTMLMIDHYVPEPDRDAGSRLIIDLIRSLQADRWNIKFWPDNLRSDPVYTSRLQQMGVEVMHAPRVMSFDKWLKAHRREIDLIFLSRPTIALYYMQILGRRSPVTPTIFFGHDLHAARMRMQSRVLHDRQLAIEAEAMEAVERNVWRAADLVLYPSQEEADEVAKLEPSADARTMVPFCFDEFPSLRSAPASFVIQFVAGFAHTPNIDAAQWLVKEILPLVRREMPAATLSIIGSNPAQAVKDLANDFIEVTGYVTADELAIRYVRARVAVAPLRVGAGVKLKVVEALQQGLPLVTTPVGAQGLEGLAEVIPVLDEPETLAKALIRLLNDDANWTGQAERQLNYARAHFSREASRAAMRTATEAAIANAAKRRLNTPLSRAIFKI